MLIPIRKRTVWQKISEATQVIIGWVFCVFICYLVLRIILIIL
jgi:hypothetical protein